MGVLSQARKGVIDAIRNHPSTANAFQRRWMFDAEIPLGQDSVPLLVPSLADLPALLVYPITANTQWVSNRRQDWTYQIGVKIWTPGTRIEAGEDLVEAVVDAMWNARPAVNLDTYVDAATGNSRGILFGGLSIANERLIGNGAWATTFSFAVGISMAWNPKAE